jgi:hypothetical protein
MMSYQLEFFIATGLISAVASCVGAVAVNVVRFMSKRDIAADANWVAEFDLDRYRGMAELFRRDDFDFLEAQPGYVPQIAARLRADRIKIARGYLNRLEREIRMLLNTANRLAVQSSEDVNDFSAFLLKKEVSFAFAITMLRLRLFLMRVGIRNPIPFDALLKSLQPLVATSRQLAVSAG